MRPPIFTQADLAAIRATPSGPCAKCDREIAPGTLYASDRKGRPVHIGACPVPGPFTAARNEARGP